MHDNVNTGSFVIFEWDDDKAAANLRKHHVAFELAELVWDDPAHIIVFDRYENDEERWHAIGLVRVPSQSRASVLRRFHSDQTR